jgi:hypothetical protein
LFHSDRFGHSSAELLPRPSARSAEDRSGHILGCLGLHTLDDGRVNVQRDVGRGVTEAVGYNLRVDAGAQGEARPCVTEIVKADPGEWIGCVVLVEPCEFAVELPGETIGVVRLAGCVAKQAVAAVGRTDQKAILGLTLPLRRRTATVPASSSITRARPVLVDPIVASWPTTMSVRRMEIQTLRIRGQGRTQSTQRRTNDLADVERSAEALATKSHANR